MVWNGVTIPSSNHSVHPHLTQMYSAGLSRSNMKLPFRLVIMNLLVCRMHDSRMKLNTVQTVITIISKVKVEPWHLGKVQIGNESWFLSHAQVGLETEEEMLIDQKQVAHRTKCDWLLWSSTSKVRNL